jgi:hypothetical protein
MAKVTRTPGPAKALLEAALKRLDTVEGRVGWFSGSSYPNGGPPVAYVASIHEFGYPEGNIPPRLGMRGVNRDERNAWSTLSQKLAREVVAGKRTPDAMMEAIGGKAAGDYRKHITGPIQPPLKPATVVARLGRYSHVSKKVISVTVAHPLTDTKLLLNTLTNTVEPSGGGS